MNKLNCCLSLLVAAGVALGETFRVPSELPTIQAALDTISDGDTILVAPGLYAEALYAPALWLVLKGEIADSTEDLRPIIDPASLPGSDTLSCLRLPELARAVIEDFVFKNGAEMYPHLTAGGIWSRALSVTLRRCLFDSTHRSLHQQCCPDQEGIVDSLVDCVFRNTSLHAVNALDYPVIATNCDFQSGTGTQFVLAGDGSKFHSCRFAGGPQISCLTLNGDRMDVWNCTFGPSPIWSTAKLDMAQGLGNVYIRDNVFIGNTTGVAAIRARGSIRSSFLIEHNSFIDHLSGAAGGAIFVGGDTFIPDRGGTIRDNVFLNCFASGSGANAIYGNADIYVYDNLIRETTGDPYGNPAIRILNGSHSQINANQFLNTGFALQSNADTLNATQNWWGHSSGPYHAGMNPTGLGDTVVGNADFDPWLADTLGAEPAHSPVPLQFQLSVFPNPFNSNARLVLTGPAGLYSVDLYNLLGQHVMAVWQGSVAERETISFDGSGLSTGLYLLYVRKVLENRSVAIEKVVLLK